MSLPRSKISTFRTNSISTTDEKYNNTLPIANQRIYRIRQKTNVDEKDTSYSLSSLSQSIQNIEEQWTQLKNTISISPRSAHHSSQRLTILKPKIHTELKESIDEKCLTERMPLKHKYPKVPTIRKNVKYLIPLAQIYLGTNDKKSSGLYISVSPKANSSIEKKAESLISQYINNSPKAKINNHTIKRVGTTPKESTICYQKTENTLKHSFNISKWIKHKLYSPTRNKHFPTFESSGDTTTNI